MLKLIVYTQMMKAGLADRIAGLGRDEDGATMVEYAIMLTLIAVALVTAIGLASGLIQNVWSSVCNALNGTC